MKTPLDRGFFSRDNAKKFARLNGKSLRSGMASRVIGPWDWIFLPALLAVAATVVLGTPFQPFGFQLPEPVWPLILAFAWPLIRPSYIAPVVLGALGLFLDFYWSAPGGFYTLNLMLVYGVLILVRAYVAGQDWRVVFGAYLAAELAFFSIGVLFMALDTGFVVRLWGVFEQMVATTALFPIVLYMLEKFVNADVRFQ
jgi:rod shape-determining protein MreD